MISILILTRNEELDLPGCLQSVAWSDDIHIFDSFSTDRTIEIARAAGVTLTQRVFDNYAEHRNAALRNLPFKHEWLLLLDADERPTQQLSEEMLRRAETAPSDVNGFILQRRDFFRDTWLKHAQISPFYIRLVRPAKAAYTRAINEVINVEGRIERLEHYLDHYPFSKGISHWLRKHDLYSTMEAELIFRQQGLQHPSLRTALFDKDFPTRRLHQKALFYRLPGRPIIKWLYMMFVRRAILDGSAGITYATLQSIYEYMIVLKTEELRRNARGPVLTQRNP